MNAGVVQQVGTPVDIYDRPQNTFVASFIGSPAMNLMEGTLENGVFTGENVKVTGLSKDHSGPVTLGFRAEDAEISDKAAAIEAPVYSMELLGEATMVTAKAGGNLVSVKAAKDYRSDIGDTVHVSIPGDICHLFDGTSGERLD